MPIYQLFEKKERKKRIEETTISHLDLMENRAKHTRKETMEAPDIKNRFFAATAARLFFLLLLFVDIFWGGWSLILFLLSLVINGLSGFKLTACRRFFHRRYVNIKRAAICAISLLVAIFSPALGTMFACSYFLMYDKEGVEEIVPSVLHDQFREFFSF